MNNEVLTTSRAAQLCHVSRFTIRNWVENGKLRSSRTAGGHRRISREDLLKFMPEETETKSKGALTENGIEGLGNSNRSWKNTCDELDSSTEKLMQKLKTCGVEQLPELQAKIKGLEECRRLTKKVLLNLIKVKEILNS